MNVTKMTGFATASGLGERECPICGKPFSPAVEHAYKAGKGVNRKLVCSYTCQRAWEKNPAVLKKGANPRIKYGNNRIAVQVVETGEVFDTILACAAKLGISTCSVHRCIYYGDKVKGLHIQKVKEGDK